MPNTYSQLYVQAVFAVKYRDAVIAKEWKPRLMGVIGNMINEAEAQTILVNGVEDHVHCFFRMKPAVLLSNVMQIAKARSSKWVNESGLLSHRFEWQTGYGAFSYSHSQVENVRRYIANQEAHHQKQTFREEYLDMLVKFGIDYDEAYIFNELV